MNPSFESEPSQLERVLDMVKNVGTMDRLARGIGAFTLLLAAWFAPLSTTMRFAVLAPMAVYMAFTALGGTCFGYRLLGKSSCGLSSR
ncbi:MAG TPA: DUF2892 domain-containing protein [Polyangiaceae bacterium]|nr:DUF2892 domain-containing protein [Polyangiaceae bacterium]